MMWPNAAFNMLSAPTASIIVNSKYKNQFFDENLKWFIDAEWYIDYLKVYYEKSGIIFLIIQEFIHSKLTIVLQNH